MKYLQRKKGEKTHEAGQKGERDVLRRLGAKPTRRSGAGLHKGDGRKTVDRGVLHLEIKTTAKNSYSIKKVDLMTLMREAMGVRWPALIINFTGFPSTKWVAIPLSTFESLTGMTNIG